MSSFLLLMLGLTFIRSCYLFLKGVGYSKKKCDELDDTAKLIFSVMSVKQFFMLGNVIFILNLALYLYLYVIFAEKYFIYAVIIGGISILSKILLCISQNRALEWFLEHSDKPFRCLSLHANLSKLSFLNYMTYLDCMVVIICMK